MAISDIKNYILKSYEHQGIIVLADHDMSIGTNPDHIHGSWQFDIRSFRKIMKYCYQNKRFNRLWVTTGNEFIKWYSDVRNIQVKKLDIIKRKNGCEYIIKLEYSMNEIKNQGN